MCELFGVSSMEKIQVNGCLRALMSHSTDHPHGWGMAIAYAGGVNIEKEPKIAWASDYLQSRLSRPIYARNLIAHIRLATVGSMAYENCHPFVDRDNSGRAWTLAHNGTIFQSALLDGYQSVQEGSTDSERILCHIIHEMNLAGTPDETQRFRILDRIILEIAEYNKLNLMIFDGEILYIHTNMQSTLYRSERQGAMLFATVPLDDGEWEQLPMMQLLAYRDGKLIAAGTRHEFEYRKPDPSTEDALWCGL